MKGRVVGVVVAAFAAWASAASAAPWSPAAVDGGRALNDISCSFGDACGAIDGSGTLVWSSTPSGGAGAWGPVTLDPDATAGVETDALNCYSPLDCVTVDTAGHVVSAENRSPWVMTSPLAVDAPHRLTDVSCAQRVSSQPGFCVLVDNRGDAVISNDLADGAGVQWSAPFPIDGSTALNAVSCAYATLCVAVDKAGGAVVSTDAPLGPGSTWHPVSIDPGHSLSDVECVAVSPSADELSVCAAVDDAGRVLVTTRPTGTWTVRPIDARAALSGVSCASSSLCVASDRAGEVIASGDPAGSSPVWSTTAIAAHALAAVSCEPMTFACAAADDAGNVYTTTDPLGTLGGGGSGGGGSGSGGGSGGGGSGSGGGAPGHGSVALPKQRDRVAHGVVPVEFSCTSSSCRGTVTLLAKRHGRLVTLGAAGFSTGSGAARILVPVNRTARKLARRHRHGVRVTLRVTTSTTVSRRIKLLAS